MKQVVHQCDQCAKVCPAMMHWALPGHLSVRRVLQHLACDVTHVGGQAYLTMVDSASWFAVWQWMTCEMSQEVQQLLLEVFMMLGPPEEILTDNGLCFCGEELWQLLTEWKVEHQFAGAYRPQGNGLCECNHHTIKTAVG